MWLTSAVSILVTYATTFALLSGLPDGLWWKLATIMSCGTIAGAVIPALVKVLNTSVSSRHTHEVVKSSAQGGASLNILSAWSRATSPRSGWGWRSWD